jgi:N-acyl amino acid synthase of PEP-CTERM/exosortase system
MGLNASSCLSPDRTVEYQDRYFRSSCVDGTPELEATYRIRHQVYCVERGFLSERTYPNGLELDEYDSHALHLLAKHHAGEPAGTLRLVMHSELGFPLMRHCVFSGEHAFLNDPSHPAMHHFAEISRVAVSKVFRRRAGDSPYGGPPRFSQPQGSAGGDVIDFPIPMDTPEILTGLFRVLYQESKRRGVTHWMGAMERGLFVLLKRAGFVMIPAGPEVDYYGPVRPYVASIAELEARLNEKDPQKLRYMVRGLEPALLPSFLYGQKLGLQSVVSAA